MEEKLYLTLEQQNHLQAYTGLEIANTGLTIFDKDLENLVNVYSLQFKKDFKRDLKHYQANEDDYISRKRDYIDSLVNKELPREW
jgi:hypothetical protein